MALAMLEDASSNNAKQKAFLRIGLVSFLNYKGPTTTSLKKLLFLAREEALSFVPSTSMTADENANEIIVADTVKRAYTFKMTTSKVVLDSDQSQCLELFEFLFREYWSVEILLEGIKANKSLTLKLDMPLVDESTKNVSVINRDTN